MVLKHHEEFLLQLVDLKFVEEWVDESKVSIGQAFPVIPDFASDKQAAQDQWPVGGRFQRDACKSCQSIDVDEADDAADRVEGQAVVKGIDESENLVLFRNFTEQLNLICIELFAVFINVFLL